MTRQNPRPSAYQWLWAELARRFGADVAEELKAGYLEQNKIACRMKWHSPESRLSAAREATTKARDVMTSDKMRKVGDKVFVTADNFGSPAVIIETRESTAKPDSHYKVRTDSGDAFWAFDFEVSDPTQEAGGA